MEGFTIIDAVVAAVVIVSAILAYSRGFVREALAIGGWIAATVIAYIFAPRALPLVNEIPIIKDKIGDNCQLGLVIAFVGVGLIALLVFTIFTPLFSSAVQRSALGGIDQILGFLFGVARGALLVIIALVLYNRLIGDATVAMVEESRTAKIYAEFEGTLNGQIPAGAPGWFEAKYNALFDAACSGAPLSSAPAPAPAPAAATP